MNRKFARLFILLLLTTFVLSACSWNPFKKKTVSPVNNQPVQTNTTADNNSDNNTSIELKKFDDLAALRKFLQENAGGASTGLGAGLAISQNKALVSEMAPAADMGRNTSNSSPAQAASVTDYSLTNNQVSGVDEGDIIKTDGTYVYALVYNDLYIIKAAPAAEAQVLSKITFKSRPANLYISGDRLAVFGADDQIYTTKMYESFRRRNPFSFLKVFDISDKKSPALVRDLEFEGSYTDSRLIGDYLYFITSNYSYLQENEPLLPRVIDQGQVISEKCDISGNRCYAPPVYYFDASYDSYNFLSVNSVNLKDNGEALSGQVYLLNSANSIYVSPENIYLTYTKYLDQYELAQTLKRGLVYDRLNASEKEKITKIEAAEAFLLNKYEKRSKVAQIIDNYVNSLKEAEAKSFETDFQAKLQQKYTELAKEMEQTLIYKIGINKGQLEYKAKGSVIGQVLNQFSLDEYKGNLRIATTKSQLWMPYQATQESSESYSNIYVLDGDLKVLSGLENLATTERIYAARFLGDRAYIVTYRQTDPIFVIGLADPQNPKVLASLKIPGFSTYIHPYDETGNKIIGIGKSTEESADGSVKVKGLKLSLFDFTDLSKPKETDSYLIGGVNSDSIALYDHKAFLFSLNKDLLVLPAAVYSEAPETSGQLSFGGALVMGVKNDKFVLKGKIDHSDGGKNGQADYWQGFNYYDNSVKRSLYINNDLLTFSNRYLMINSLVPAGEDQLPFVKKLELATSTPPMIIPMLRMESGVSAGSAGAASPPATNTIK